MQVKVINNDKVKILIEDKDFDDFIDFKGLVEFDRLNEKEFMFKILCKTYEQTGLDFLNSKILVDIIPGASTSFYIVVTRIQTEKTVGNSPVKADEDMYLFELHYPECIYDIAEILTTNKVLKIGSNKMFKYKNKYYFMINFPPETVSSEQFKYLINDLTKYSCKCKWSIMNEGFLMEWGEILISQPVKKLK